MIQDTWSGCHAQVDDYESDTESEDFNEDTERCDVSLAKETTNTKHTHKRSEALMNE